MKIYTKAGDQGETGLFGGKRVPKNYVRIEVLGAIDEANANLGLAISHISQATYRAELKKIQAKLFDVGTILANPTAQDDTHLHDHHVHQLEAAIDDMTARLPDLRAFILPGGTKAATYLHVARAVVRRAERRAVTVSQHQSIPPVAIRYLNRLSDYLFTLARIINFEAGAPETEWHQS